MKTTRNQVPTQFAPDTRFELPAAPRRGAQEIELERLKQRLLLQLLQESGPAELNLPFRRAANEAASLAWLTPVPLLVFPALLEEKARVARSQTRRQSRIRRTSRRLLAEVV